MSPKNLLGLIASIIIIKAAIAQDSYITPQVTRPNDPMGVAMALTGTAYTNGVYAPLSNPAGLAETDGLEVSFSHFPSTDSPSALDSFNYLQNAFNQEAFAMAIRLPRGFAIGLNFYHLDTGKDVSSNFKTGDSRWVRQLQISLARIFTISNKVKFSLGLSPKYLHETYDDIDETGWLFDLGARLHFLAGRKWLAAGIAIQNLGDDLTFKSESGLMNNSSKPFRYLRLGVAAGLHSSTTNASGINPGIVVTAEFQQSVSQTLRSLEVLASGVELNIFQYLFLRTGYRHNITNTVFLDFEGWTYGAGIKTPENFIGFVPLSIELSYGRGVDVGSLNMNIFAARLNYRLQ